MSNFGSAGHTASDVAKWFFQRNDAEDMTGEADLISPLKIQKLLYYAQGTFLAMTGKALFDEVIQAWTHGPVVDEVYQEYRDRGRLGVEFTEALIPQETYLEEEERILEQVYYYFGQFSAWKLRNMTHEETPWKKTDRGGVISLKLIYDYFKAEYIEDATA